MGEKQWNRKQMWSQQEKICLMWKMLKERNSEAIGNGSSIVDIHSFLRLISVESMQTQLVKRSKCFMPKSTSSSAVAGAFRSVSRCASNGKITASSDTVAMATHRRAVSTSTSRA